MAHLNSGSVIGLGGTESKLPRLLFLHWWVLLLVLGCLDYGAATITLNSTVDGRQAACPGEMVTYTCTVIQGGSLTWTAAPVLTDTTLLGFIPNTPSNERMRSCSDASSTVPCADLDYQATLTSVGTVDINGAADMTSTFRFTATTELDGTVVQCSAVTLSGPQMDAQDLIVAGPPSAPLNLTCPDRQYGRDNVSLTVQWELPLDEGGDPVDSFSITVSTGYANVTSETSASLDIPYNEMHTISIVATNCNGNGNATMKSIVFVNCGTPGRPINGSFDPYQNTLEGAEITFRCNSPNETILVECGDNGIWTPNPANLACRCDPATTVCTPVIILPLNVALVAGIVSGVGGLLVVSAVSTVSIGVIYGYKKKKKEKGHETIEFDNKTPDNKT